MVASQQCEVWRQAGTKLDLRSALFLMLFWTGQVFWGVAECWEVVDKLLHFGGRRENAEISNAFRLMGEMCLGSIALAQNEDIVGSSPSFSLGTVGYWDLVCSLPPAHWCFLLLLFRSGLGWSKFITQ